MVKRSAICQVAIEKAGGAGELARTLGTTHQAIYKWRRVPRGRLSEVSRITGIPEKELRPDLSKLLDLIERHQSRLQPGLQRLKSGRRGLLPQPAGE